jgi:hypothetical protein
MIRIKASVQFQGEKFSPNNAEKETGITFSEKNEVGDIGKTGRYKGKPLPDGRAGLDPPKSVVWHERVSWLINYLEGKIDIIRKCGASDMHFSVAYYYDKQCNCDLSIEEIKGLANLGIPYWFSVYQIDDLNQID